MNEQLISLIKTKISESEGMISFSDFMELVLYAPGLGYYVAGKNKLGSQGDFVTAPEISSLFSYSVANQCLQVLKKIENASILELGAGSGRMAVDILLYLEEQQSLPEHYFILELSPDLQAQQRETVQHCVPRLSDRIVWLNSLPLNFKGVILANEVMDALPVHRFFWTGESFVEQAVAYDEFREQFVWKNKTIPKNSRLDVALQNLPLASFSKNYCSEANLLLPAWINSLSDSLDQGLILLLDYGFPRKEFYHPERNQGTLICHYQHQTNFDPFTHIGLQDITAHVDFTAVAIAAESVKLKVAGYTNQANFLFNTDILKEFEKHFLKCKGLEGIQLQQAFRRLIEPHEMGELLKCIALTRGLDISLMGFKHGDRRQFLMEDKLNAKSL